MVSYDINFINTNQIKEMVKNDTEFEFKVADTTNLEIETTDLVEFHEDDTREPDISQSQSKTNEFLI